MGSLWPESGCATLHLRAVFFVLHTSIFGDVRNGNYFGSMELIAQFDPFLKAHIERYGNAGKGNPSYLSIHVCEEFLELMGEKVLTEIVSWVKLAKYFSISVDFTPDVTHIDQLTFILHYVLLKSVF